MRAGELADEVGGRRSIVGALMTRGWVEFFTGQETGLEKLERSIKIAEAAGFEGDVAAAHVVVARTAARLRMYDLAEGHLQAGL